MREFAASLTSKGQVTIPVEIRRLLGVRPREKVTFVVEGDDVRVVRWESVVARTAGILKSNRPAPTIEAMTDAAERGMAEDAMRGWNVR